MYVHIQGSSSSVLIMGKARRPVALTTAEEFSQVATTHGVYYVFAHKYGRLSQLAWLVICVALMSLSIFWIKQAYDDWKKNPVLTSVSTTGLPIREVNFPAITICGMGMIDSVLDSAIRQQAIEYLMAVKGLVTPDTLNLTFNDPEALLAQNGETYDKFAAALYPGLVDLRVEEIVAIMAAQKPDAYLFSSIAAEGGYNPCNDVVTVDAANFDPCDGDAYDLDSDGSYCARPLEAKHSASGLLKDKTVCDEELGEVEFTVESDYELGLLAELLTNSSSKLSTLKTSTFWVKNVRDEDDGNFYFNDLALKPTDTTVNLTMMTIQGPQNDWDKSCFVLTYDQSVATFKGRQANCEEKHSVICVKAALPFCSAEDTSDNTEEVNSETDAPPKSKLDLLLDPTQVKETNRGLAQKTRMFREAFLRMNMVESAEALFEALWYSQLPCFDNSITMLEGLSEPKALLRKCLWKGKFISCAAIFKTFPTDRGMCCTFNMEAAEKIFQESEYAKDITKMQTKDVNFVKPKGAAKTPPWYTTSEPSSEAGVNKGLTLFLDAHTNLISAGSIKEDYQGFIAVVGSSNEYQLTELRNIRIRPGFDNLVAISAKDVRASESLKGGVEPQKRGCYFADEYKLTIHSKYTQDNCLLECRITHAKEQTEHDGKSCVPWYLPREQLKNVAIEICDPWRAQNFSVIMKDTPYEKCLHCLPDCDGTLYNTVVTTVPFRDCDEKNLGVSVLCDLKGEDKVDPPIYRHLLEYEYEASGDLPSYVKGTSNLRSHSNQENNIMFKKFKDELYNAYEKDIATVSFYFESPSVFQFTRDLRMTWTDFLSQIGGLMGLSIGFSLCSGVEFVYWFTIRLWFNLIPGQTSSRSEAKSHRRAKSSQGQSQTQIPMSWTTDG